MNNVLIKPNNHARKPYKKTCCICTGMIFSFLLGGLCTYLMLYPNPALLGHVEDKDTETFNKVAKQIPTMKEVRQNMANTLDNDVNKTISGRTKVLLLSYSRSGSSLVGEMISAHPSSSYYFEPLWQHNLSCVHEMNSTMVAKRMENVIGGLLNCHWPQIKQLKPFSFRKNSSGCNKTTISVVKTIRLHLNGVIPWIRKNPTLKIIHLIRDPRAQTKSRLKLRGSFKCTSADIPGYCKSVLDDLKLGSELPPEIYRLVRYEDLVLNPMDEMENLYKFLGVPFNNSMKDYVYKHFHAEKVTRKIRDGPQGTFKTSDFDNSDIRGLPEGIKKTVEKSCREVMEFGKYIS